MEDKKIENFSISEIEFKIHDAVNLKQLFKREKFETFYVELKPGKEIPVHVHEDKDQTVIVLGGEGVYTAKNQKITVFKNKVIFVQRGIGHGFKNTGTENLCYFEMGIF